jgi:hypothetical protein
LQFVNAVASTLPKRSAVRVDVSEFVLAW